MEDLQCEASLITEIVNNLCLPSTSACKHMCILWYCVLNEATGIFSLIGWKHCSTADVPPVWVLNQCCRATPGRDLRQKLCLRFQSPCLDLQKVKGSFHKCVGTSLGICLKCNVLSTPLVCIISFSGRQTTYMFIIKSHWGNWGFAISWHLLICQTSEKNKHLSDSYSICLCWGSKS